MKHLQKMCIKRLLAVCLVSTLLFSNVSSAFAANHLESTEEKAITTETTLLENFVKTLPRLKAETASTIRVIVEVSAKADADEVKKQILKIKGTEIVYEYSEIINGFSLNISRDRLDQLFAVEGIEKIDYSDELIPAMVNAKQLTNVIKVQEEYKAKHSGKGELDGRGMVIATLDSGIDINSSDLKLDKGNRDGIDEDVFEKMKIKDSIFKNKDGTPNYKVPYAFNYFRGDTTLIDEVPKPHGMHIAGILAGNSGDPQGFKGIAPNAQLLVYKVITYDRKTDTRPDLVEYVGEDAAFHAMDDAVARGADVISLSIGNQGTGGSNDIWDSAVKKAYEKGVVVVAAMGNWASSNSESSYDIYADEGIALKDNSSTVSVAANPQAIGVGCTYNTHLELPTVTIGDMAIPYKDISKFNGDKFKQTNELSAPFIDVGRGMEGFDKPEDFQQITGKIVVARRGGEAIKEKALRFLKKGAKGFILINDVTDFSRGNSETHPVIGYEHLSINEGWAIGISGDDGAKLIKLIQEHTGNIDVKFDTTERAVQLKNKTGISGFSSWGPNYNLEIKPDIVAPGEDIRSLGNHDTYTIMSGTSMASPHIAAMATLILQHLKNTDANEEVIKRLHLNKVDFVKLLLMNTATVLKDSERENIYEYSPRRQGAGVVDLDKALSSDVILTYHKNKGAISLKEIKENTKEFTVTAHNFGNKTRKFSIENSEVLHEISVDRVRKDESKSFHTKTLHLEPIQGASLTGARELVIPPNSSVELKFTLNTGTANEEFVEGFIYFKSKDEEQSDLSIPYMGFKGDWNKEEIFDAGVWDKDSKTHLVSLFSVKGDGHDSEYIEMGREGNRTLGKETEPLEIDPSIFALNSNPVKNVGTEIKEVVPRIIFLRAVETFEVSIVKEKDENAQPVKILNTAHYPRKYIHNIYREGGQDIYEKPDDFNKWTGRAYNPKTGEYKQVAEGQYYYRLKAKNNKNDKQYQTLFIPIKVDNTNPKITSVKLDKEKSEVRITTEDNFGIWKVSASIDGAQREVFKVKEHEYVIPNVKLSKITQGTLVVEAMDYAGNQAVKCEEKLNDQERVVDIANIDQIIKNIDKTVELLYPVSVKKIKVTDGQGKEIVLTEKDEDGKKKGSFRLDQLGADKTFTVEWTTKDSITTKETFTLALQPRQIIKKEKDESWDTGDDEFTYRDISLEPGLFFSYDKVGKDIAGNKIEYEKDEHGNVTGMKLEFYISVSKDEDEGWDEDADEDEDEEEDNVVGGENEIRTAEITNINVNYNRLNNISGHEPMGKVHATEDKDTYQIPVANGVNLINVKVYKEKGNEKQIIYNRGFFVYIDTGKPSVTFDNDNIVYNEDYREDEEDDDDFGKIYTKDGTVTLKGEIDEDLDGVTLSINDNMVENFKLPGEFGYNRKKFEHTILVEAGDKLKVEVKDYSENTRKLFFEVVEDQQAPEITITPENASEINKDTVLQINFADNLGNDDNHLNKTIFVNGKAYQKDELRNYAVEGDEGQNKFYIVAKAVDKAGNETLKEIKVNVDSNFSDTVSPKKDTFTIEELKEAGNIFEIPKGMQVELVETKIDEDEHTARLKFRLRDVYSFEKTYVTSVKLVERNYTEDKTLSLQQKKKEWIQGLQFELEDLFEIPDDLGVVALNKIDTSTTGTKLLKVKLFKGERFNIVEYPIQVLPEMKTLSYESNGGTVYGREEYEKGTHVKLDKQPTKTGFVFAGWYQDEQLLYLLEEIELIEDTTVYAKWIPEKSRSQSKRHSSSNQQKKVVEPTPTNQPEKVPTPPTPIVEPHIYVFADASKNMWYYDAVQFVCSQGLFSGVSNDNFAPNENMTRAMLVMVIYRLAGTPESGMPSFTDVPSDQWYTAAVAWAQKNNIMNGISEKEFAPNQNVSRQQISAILGRYARLSGKVLPTGDLSFKDAAQVDEYAKTDVAALQAAGIVNGRGSGEFAPKASATRAEVASMLMRYINFEG